jgi:trimethylamine:corrinoid methyltransferase-like protein
VRLDPALVNQALASVPAEVKLIARNPERSCRVGVATSCSRPSPDFRGRDAQHGKHPTIADRLGALSQAFDVIHVRSDGRATDVSIAELPDTSFAQLTLGDKVPYFYCRGDGARRLL